MPWHFHFVKATFGRFSLCALPMAEWRSQFRTAKPLEKTAWSGEASLPKGQTTRKYDEAIHASTEIWEKAWIA
ncbi:MAG: hypothetical protein FWD82_05240, partial [Defluviitaleaceae bacterium]|nr:hypothetical protein [Defluviitaleaceae bacterium]